MATINLLPWREELRKQQQQDFVMTIVAAVVATCLLFLLVYMQIEGMKEYQQRRNGLIQKEIRAVDKKIKEIKDIELKKRKLLTKIEVIQTLQESRPEIVHLFDELPKSTPEGVFLTKFKQTGKNLVLTGKAQSNARVSAYMRGIEASTWLEKPVLQVIKGKTASGALNDFTMLAKQGNKSQADKDKKGGK
ncbi:MAG: pilus assembly protein PilN [Methylococcaceae bacterium]|nr:pilus assembly protein PilN [Methylococcaceae bacterium]